MLRFLSDAWVQALDERARGIRLTEALGEVELRVEHVVDEVVYHVVVHDRAVRFVPGPAADPTVRLVTTRAHAAAIAQGRTSAQRVFMNGGLAVEGDTHALVLALPAMREIDDMFAEVRAATDWADA